MTAFKDGWDQVDDEKRDRRAPLPLHPLFQRQGPHRICGFWAKGNGLAYWGPQVQKLWTPILTLMSMYPSLLASQQIISHGAKMSRKWAGSRRQVKIQRVCSIPLSPRGPQIVDQARSGNRRARPPLSSGGIWNEMDQARTSRICS